MAVAVAVDVVIAVAIADAVGPSISTAIILIKATAAGEVCEVIAPAMAKKY